jgi:hypothetical protein
VGSVLLVDGRPQIRLTLESVDVDALVDTGASRTLMNLDIFNQVCLAQRRPNLLKSTGPLVSVTGGALNVQGETNLKLSNNIVARVVVVADLPHSLLLGTDLMRQCQGTIDYARQLVHLNGQAFPFITSVSDPIDFIGDTQMTTGDAAIDRVLRRHARAFHREGDPIGYARHTAPMRIITEGPPLAQRSYRAPLLRRQLIDNEIDNMLRDGIIRPSQSPWSSPVLIVPKKRFWRKIRGGLPPFK